MTKTEDTDYRLKLANALLLEALDALEFSESTIINAYEGRLDSEAAKRIAKICSNVLLKHGRTSLFREDSPEESPSLGHDSGIQDPTIT